VRCIAGVVSPAVLGRGPTQVFLGPPSLIPQLAQIQALGVASACKTGDPAAQ
jgi:hypothetical protein